MYISKILEVNGGSMTTKNLIEKTGFKVVNEGETRDVLGIYACDLLSIVMGRATADFAWITVMGNMNSIAVATLTDVSCIVLSEGMNLDEDALKKAQEQDVCVLKTDLPTYETALVLKEALCI